MSRYAALYAKRKSRTDQVGDPARRYRELADQEEVRRLVIEAARDLVRAKAAPKGRRRKTGGDARTEPTDPAP